MKKAAITILGVTLITLGLIFILLPGPAIIFIPLGLALLSTQYVWARSWLRKSQRMMRDNAVKLDLWWLKVKRRSK